MTVRDRVYSAFKESFDLDDGDRYVVACLSSLPGLDFDRSHDLVAALESEFDTMLETDDILEMSNFDKTVSIMSKYANEA